MFRVRDLVRELELPVLAGDTDLDTPVRGVQSSDLPDPTPWLEPGDLLLTTAAQLETADAQRDFIAKLIERDVAGVGVGTGLAHQEVPPALVAAATEHELLLFEVPARVPFIAVTRAISARLDDERHRAFQRTMTSQDELEQILSSKPGLGTLAEALAQSLSAAVMVFDRSGRPLVERGKGSLLNPTLLAALRDQIRDRSDRGDSGPLAVSDREHNLTGLGLAVSSRASHNGNGAEPAKAEAWLVAVRKHDDLTDVDRVLLRQAVPLAALELLRHRLAEEGQRRTASELLSAVVNGELTESELVRRLAAFGLTDTVAALMLEPSARQPPPLARVESALRVALRREAAPGLVACTGGTACALVPGLPNDELFEVAGRVGQTVSAELNATVLVAAGRAVELRETRRTFDEARCALEARALAMRGAQPADPASSPAVATFRDLGSYQLLLALQGSDSLRRFCDSILGPIEAMESAYGGELLRSLQVFIELNGQWERAARQLYCHRHTLRYRIRKIEELTDRDLESASDRIEFYLALRARALLS